VQPAVDCLTLGPLATNCYVVRPDEASMDAVVVDPSGSAKEIRLELASRGARCAAILVTHGHFDHITALAGLAEGTGAPVYAPAAERALLERPAEFTPPELVVRPWTADTLLEGGEILELAGLELEVIAAPGHSPGHLTFRCERALFSGDVLFEGGVGRTDLPGGDWTTLLSSLRTLVERLPAETVVYPGHGPATTLGAELARNPFLAELRAERVERR
jgi:glyoxylase-like metal-dependent hydrolase (beta-lactamase superfamily II)